MKNEHDILKMTWTELAGWAVKLQSDVATHERQWAGGGNPDEYPLYEQEEKEAKRIQKTVEKELQRMTSPFKDTPPCSS